MKKTSILCGLVAVVTLALAGGLPGTQHHPPDTAVAPPNQGSFSTRTTSSPWSRAVIAAAIPAAPDPTTRRSQSRIIDVVLAAESAPPAFCRYSARLT